MSVLVGVAGDACERADAGIFTSALICLYDRGGANRKERIECVTWKIVLPVMHGFVNFFPVHVHVRKWEPFAVCVLGICDENKYPCPCG